MRVFFTDFDGCINSAQSAELHYGFLREQKSDLVTFKPDHSPGCRADEFCPVAVSNLNYILKHVPDLKVVVSSFWRWGRTVEELRDYFTWLGLPADRIIGKTPIINGVQRGVEIMTWLKDHPEVTKYAIMDDDTDMEGTDLNSFFWCDAYLGLTYRDAIKIIQHFEPNKWKNETPLSI